MPSRKTEERRAFLISSLDPDGKTFTGNWLGKTGISDILEKSSSLGSEVYFDWEVRTFPDISTTFYKEIFTTLMILKVLGLQWYI